MLSGALRLEASDGSLPAQQIKPGDAVGVHEALAGSALGSTRSHASRLTVAEASAALRIDSDDLFDLLGQRPELLQQIFSALFSKQGLETAETSQTGADDA